MPTDSLGVVRPPTLGLIELTDELTAHVDHVLRTTRSVRRRLDLTRPVTDSVILDCIDAAEQAPTGGNQSSRRWLVIRDPATKQALADLYRSAGGAWMLQQSDALTGSGDPNEKVMASAAHLVDHLHEVPAIVLVTIWGEHDGSGRPGLFDSVIQSAWSFCLALRSRGLGTAWTTMHLNEADGVAGLLGIPDGVSQIVLLPVAHTIGTDFREAPREPTHEIVYHDRWGNTAAAPHDGEITFAGAHGVTVEIDIDARADAIWPLISDIDLPGRFSDEFRGGDWLDEPGPGARFIGRNHNDALGDWETTSYVVVHDPPWRFGWNVSEVENPGTCWRFECIPLAGATRLRFSMTFGPGTSGLTYYIDLHPEHEAEIIRDRQAAHRENMERTIEGIKTLVDGTVGDEGVPS